MIAREASEYLGFSSENALRVAVSRRQIPHLRIGKRLRFSRRQLDAWIREQSVPAESER